MRVLLDTHVFIWVTIDSPRITSASRHLIEDASAVYVSAASIWEIAIKSALGKIKADPEELSRAIGQSGFIPLPVRAIPAKVGTGFALGIATKQGDRAFQVTQSSMETL